MQMVQDVLDLGTALSETTFVVVDLETTGGNPAECGITEIGAVRVRGGVVLGELQTFVDPGCAIPPFIQTLTGITDAMVRDAPRIDAALPAFLEFARGAVLVAHNARFDIGFLKAAAERTATPWPGFQVLDTVHLARQLVTKDEAPNHKLATLARVFGASVQPTHRALDDARATVDVLHGLIERVGTLGVSSLEELRSYSARVPASTRRKRHLADGLPHSPGVYVFSDDAGTPLYVGTSGDIRTRVLTYFTAAERRRRMRDMVALATSVTPIVCATRVEAQVREVRLIAEHRPRFNRRSTRPDRAAWVRITDEPFPRLSIVGRVRAGDIHVGPFPSRAVATEAVEALHEAVPIRRCTTRISARTPPGGACALAEMGRCVAPCTGSVDVDEYRAVVDDIVTVMAGDASSVVEALTARMAELAASERFEEAATVRDRTLALVRGASRAQRIAPLAASPELVAARRLPAGGWEAICVRHGRFAASVSVRPGVDPVPAIDAMRATAEVVPVPDTVLGATIPEETDILLRWLEQPGVRLVHLDGVWDCPVGGAQSAWARLEPVAQSARGAVGFAS